MAVSSKFGDGYNDPLPSDLIGSAYYKKRMMESGSPQEYEHWCRALNNYLNNERYLHTSAQQADQKAAPDMVVVKQQPTPDKRLLLTRRIHVPA